MAEHPDFLIAFIGRKIPAVSHLDFLTAAAPLASLLHDPRPTTGLFTLLVLSVDLTIVALCILYARHSFVIFNTALQYPASRLPSLARPPATEHLD
jgi:hypothetical protein